jgi:uncharacterized protein YbjT (DUF2867 family)
METPGKKVVVFGGTGYYGKYIVRALLNLSAEVCVVSRNGQKPAGLFGNRVRAIEGDVCEPGVIAQAISGKDAVIIALNAMTWKLIRRQRSIERDAVLEIIKEARARQVSRLIYLSGYELRKDVLESLGILDFGSIKMEIESKLEQSGLNYTILGCAPSFQLFFSLLRGNKIIIPGGGKRPIPSIAGEDVGIICAKSALMDTLPQKRFRLTGPKAYSIPQVAGLIGELTGKNTVVRAVPLTGLNIASKLIQPINPFLRELYKSVKLLNNFPADLVEQVHADHQKLIGLFDYTPKSLEEEIREQLIPRN